MGGHAAQTEPFRTERFFVGATMLNPLYPLKDALCGPWYCYDTIGVQDLR